MAAHRKDLDDSTIIDLYLQGKSSTEIAKQFGTSHRTILLRLKKHTIERRTLSESQWNFKSKEIPKDFTLGSVIYFQDYLYMGQDSMKKKDFLDNFKDKETPRPEYDNELTEKIVISEMPETTENFKTIEGENNSTNLWKYTRALLMFYMENTTAVEIYNKTFNDSKQFVTDEEIENLSVTISLAETLKYLSDEKLKEFTKENNIPVRSDREKQEKLVVFEISQR